MAFTSALSVQEFALARSLGLRPLRLVAGGGVFSVYPYWFPYNYAALDPYQLRPGQTALACQGADAWVRTREQVLDRLRREAADCGADIVTGITWRERPAPSFESGRANAENKEVTAMGTALAVDGPRPPGPALRDPALTSMGLRDYAALARSGYAPAGLVMAAAQVAGRSAWDPRPDRRPEELTARQVAKEMMVTQDRPEYADATHLAYSAAVAELHAAAARLDASGITAITIERTVQTEVYGFVVRARATGTAVTAAPGGPGDAGTLAIMPVRRLDG
jgi:uncharacterized protein YbjQ (UPF0145 family)